jgi:hypothetical protein
VPAPYPDQQRHAASRLKAAFSNPAHARVVHYSCESFDDRSDGRSPRITSLAVRRLDSSDTESFSIHRVAEREGVPLDGIEARYDDLERTMLDEFFAYVRSAGEVTYLHWNMRDANYGFAAIEHRYAVLGGTPERIPEQRRLDLSPLFKDLYGSEYIGHPRLPKLAERNGITMLRGISGAEEAKAFERKDYVALHQSTLRKVDILHSLAERAYRGTLKTNASWWTVHGGNVRGAWMWVVENKSWAFIIAAVALALAVAGVILIFHPPVHA